MTCIVCKLNIQSWNDNGLITSVFRTGIIIIRQYYTRITLEFNLQINLGILCITFTFIHYVFLKVDRETVPLVPITVLSLSEVPEGHLGANEVQIGGLNTSDPRFAAYKSYSGCLSSMLNCKEIYFEFLTIISGV